jgi:hypothetical protein
MDGKPVINYLIPEAVEDITNQIRNYYIAVERYTNARMLYKGFTEAATLPAHNLRTQLFQLLQDCANQISYEYERLMETIDQSYRQGDIPDLDIGLPWQIDQDPEATQRFTMFDSSGRQIATLIFDGGWNKDQEAPVNEYRNVLIDYITRGMTNE